jgi:hypothetical protein
MRRRLASLSSLACLSLLLVSPAGRAADSLRAEVTRTDGGHAIEYRYGTERIGRSTAAAPAGVELRLPGADPLPVSFRESLPRDGGTDLGPTRVGALALRLRVTQKAPSLVERVLEVRAEAAARFAVTFPLDGLPEGEFASFSGPVKERALFDTVRGSPRVETFPVAMVRSSGQVFGIAADSPGLWENRCQALVDPPGHRLAILTGDGRDPYPLIIKPPEDARDTYQYQMDGWQTLAPGEARRFTTWVFAGPARNHYDAQVAAHLTVANGKGWTSSALEAILRNTSLFLLRRNLALDADGRPRDGRFIFISGPGYGWKQWVSDGFYTALGLDDPEKTIESNRAVFWTRMDYEDNAQYYLIWAALMRRAGGVVNEALAGRAYEFLRRNEKDGLYIPPSLPGAPNAKGWKTYHDVLPYDEDDSPSSNQGFHCGALLAAREIGLPVTDGDIERAIAAYRSLFNAERGFMPTSRKLRDTLGQDTLYGATLTFAVFGRKLLADEQVLTHVRTSEKVKTPYGLRVISAADGSLLPGHSGVYCYGGSWFLNDAANYLLAGVHGMPAADADALLAERIAREIAFVPAFNESISTVDGKPHGHVLYSWNSGYWWLRREIRKRLGQTGPDPVDAAIDRRLGVIREGGALVLDPGRSADAWDAAPAPAAKAEKKAGRKKAVPALASTPKPTLADVAYGPDPRQVLDFWRAPSERPAAQPTKPAARKITNGVEWKDERPAALPGAKRPKVESVFLYRPEAEWTYSHHPSIAFFKGRFLAIWSNGRKDEDAPGQRVLLATSEDFSRWTEPRPLVDSVKDAGGVERVLTAAGFHDHEGTLVAYFGNYGPNKETTRLEAVTTTDGDRWSEVRQIGIPVNPNHPPQRTRSGRLIICGNISFPWTDDPSGLTGWRRSGIYPASMSTTIKDDPASFREVARRQGWPAGLCEGSFFQTDDGVLNMMLRNAGLGGGDHRHRLWLTESRDDGATWSEPAETDFSDTNAKFHFGHLPDGRFYYVGNPIGGGRPIAPPAFSPRPRVPAADVRREKRLYSMAGRTIFSGSKMTQRSPFSTWPISMRSYPASRPVLRVRSTSASGTKT